MKEERRSRERKKEGERREEHRQKERRNDESSAQSDMPARTRTSFKKEKRKEKKEKEEKKEREEGVKKGTISGGTDSTAVRGMNERENKEAGEALIRATPKERRDCEKSSKKEGEETAAHGERDVSATTSVCGSAMDDRLRDE